MFRPLTHNETREESLVYKISLADLPKSRWSHESISINSSLLPPPHPLSPVTALEPGYLPTPQRDLSGSFLPFLSPAGLICLLLHQAKHDDGGSAGFVLDKPAMYEIGAVTDKLPGFEACPLYLGGDVGSGIQALHRVEELGFSQRIIDGVMMGFDPWHAKELLEQHKCEQDDFKFFYRYTRWVRGQLEVTAQLEQAKADEMNVGGGKGWQVVYRGGELRSHLPQSFTGKSVPPPPSLSLLPSFAPLPPPSFTPSSSSHRPAVTACKESKPLWKEVLELMGGRYSLISKAAFNEL
eukprot:566232-Hanusia_phi.AAC.2